MSTKPAESIDVTSLDLPPTGFSLRRVHGRPIFGPRLLAMIAWMKSRAHCSYTTIEQYFDDVLQVPVSRGYLAKLCNGVISESLADAYEETKAAIPGQLQLGSDETSFKKKPPQQNSWVNSGSGQAPRV